MVKFLKCASCNCHRNFHRKEIAIVDIEQNFFPLKIIEKEVGGGHQRVLKRKEVCSALKTTISLR
jgi:hypothetical protein